MALVGVTLSKFPLYAQKMQATKGTAKFGWNRETPAPSQMFKFSYSTYSATILAGFYNTDDVICNLIWDISHLINMIVSIANAPEGCNPATSF